MEQASESSDLDLSGAARGVWLVKVPKYLSEKWKNADSQAELGKLRISSSKSKGSGNSASGKTDVLFTVNDQLLSADAAGHTDIPKDHKFVITDVKAQSFHILSTTEDKAAIEGMVMHRAECRPLVNQSYIALKKSRLDASLKPKRSAIRLTQNVVSYKPKSAQETELKHAKQKKAEGKKVRDDEKIVVEKLYRAFEKHQYYNIKDLVKLTNQPSAYVKEILNEHCIYNMKAPHKYMWELKPEYRHYKQQKPSNSS